MAGVAPSTDPYKLLQVDPEADPEIIAVAYRKLALRYHPDVAPGPEAAAMMVALNLARDLLLDPARRAEHDRLRGAAASGSVATGGPVATGSRSGGRADARHAGAEPAGPPPGNASGSRLDFGRYAGWSLGEIARVDVAYLEWLDRMSIGRRYRDEVDGLLRKAGRRGAAKRVEEPRGLFRRR
jgi:curved DNA-binding protein CbpA